MEAYSPGDHYQQKKIPPLGPHFIKFSENLVNLAAQSLHLEVVLLSKLWSERGDFDFIENDPQGYKLLCCGGFALDFFSFIQIDVGHAVAWQTKLDSRSYYVSAMG